MAKYIGQSKHRVAEAVTVKVLADNNGQPNKKLKLVWAEQLCSALAEKGVSAKFYWQPEGETVCVKYRVQNHKWDMWKRNPQLWGGKPKRKIQTLWLLSTTNWSRVQGYMMPEQRWQCDETDAVINGSPVEFAAGLSC